MFVCQVFTGNDFENVAHVRCPLFFPLASLGAGVHHSFDGRSVDGYPCCLRYAHGDELALVVSPAQESPTVERHGNDDVDAVAKTSLSKFVAENGAEVCANLLFAVVFELVDEAGVLAVPAVEEK